MASQGHSVICHHSHKHIFCYRHCAVSQTLSTDFWTQSPESGLNKCAAFLWDSEKLNLLLVEVRLQPQDTPYYIHSRADPLGALGKCNCRSAMLLPCGQYPELPVQTRKGQNQKIKYHPPTTLWLAKGTFCKPSKLDWWLFHIWWVNWVSEWLTLKLGEDLQLWPLYHLGFWATPCSEGGWLCSGVSPESTGKN